MASILIFYGLLSKTRVADALAEFSPHGHLAVAFIGTFTNTLYWELLQQFVLSYVPNKNMEIFVAESTVALDSQGRSCSSQRGLSASGFLWHRA